MNERPRPSGDGRSTHFVNDAIAWAAVHRTTRVRATVTTFGWRGKTTLTAPPFLVFAFWAYAGVFNNGAAALAFGIPMLWADIWWAKQVWVAGPANRSDADHDLPAAAPPGPERRPPHQGLLYLYPSGSDENRPGTSLESTRKSLAKGVSPHIAAPLHKPDKLPYRVEGVTLGHR